MVPKKSFKNWLQNEAVIQSLGIQRGGMGISSMGFRDRVQRGKGVEERIKEALRAAGMNITNPTRQEDMYLKID